MVDACASAGIKAFYGPFGDFSDAAACEAQFRNAFLLGCAGAWSLHPVADRHRQARLLARSGRSRLRPRVLDAMPDGTGAVMIDGKMQDDATWKQAKVIVDLARQVAARDADCATIYGF